MKRNQTLSKQASSALKNRRRSRGAPCRLIGHEGARRGQRGSRLGLGRRIRCGGAAMIVIGQAPPAVFPDVCTRAERNQARYLAWAAQAPRRGRGPDRYPG
jgi:hypothetical protein